MIVIKSVELIETEMDWWEYYQTSEVPPIKSAEFFGELISSEEKKRYLVNGYPFHTPKGDIILGVTEEVSEKLADYLGCWVALRKKVDEQEYTISHQQTTIYKLRVWIKTPWYWKLYKALTDPVCLEHSKPRFI